MSSNELSWLYDLLSAISTSLGLRGDAIVERVIEELIFSREHNPFIELS